MYVDHECFIFNLIFIMYQFFNWVIFFLLIGRGSSHLLDANPLSIIIVVIILLSLSLTHWEMFCVFSAPHACAASVLTH